MTILKIIETACWSLALVIILFVRKPVPWWLYAIVLSVLISYSAHQIRGING